MMLVHVGFSLPLQSARAVLCAKLKWKGNNAHPAQTHSVPLGRAPIHPALAALNRPSKDIKTSEVIHHFTTILMNSYNTDICMS